MPVTRLHEMVTIPNLVKPFSAPSGHFLCVKEVEVGEQCANTISNGSQLEIDFNLIDVVQSRMRNRRTNLVRFPNILILGKSFSSSESLSMSSM